MITFNYIEAFLPLSNLANHIHNMKYSQFISTQYQFGPAPMKSIDWVKQNLEPTYKSLVLANHGNR